MRNDHVSLSRMERVDFSLPIFVDGGDARATSRARQSRASPKPTARRIAVIPGTTTERALTSALKVADVTATLVPIIKLEEGAAACASGAPTPTPATARC